MTVPLFRNDAYLTECAATVTAARESGLILDHTVFYPTGGGQPGDSGTLFWEDGECRIVTAVKGEAPGEIVHVPREADPLPPEGARVRLALNWPRRHRHMRVHTALHLLSVVIPLPVTGGSINHEKGRLDFDMPDAPGDREALEARLRELIDDDHPVTTEWITDEELLANPGLVKTMAVKPPMGQGRVRLVRIGAGDATIDLQPCGGTHVRSTAEIGAISLGKIEKKGRQNRRVTLLIDG